METQKVRDAADSAMNKRGRTGRIAEAVAAGFLQRRGARIIDRNVRVGRGELDILAELGGVRFAAEVRSRVGCDPLEAFDGIKADQIRRLARSIDPPVLRVDLVTVRFERWGVEIRWIPDVS